MKLPNQIADLISQTLVVCSPHKECKEVKSIEIEWVSKLDGDFCCLVPNVKVEFWSPP